MTWPQLEKLAKDDRLRLFRTKHAVTILTTGALEMPFLSITMGELTDEDADSVCRKLTERALLLLRGLHAQ